MVSVVICALGLNVHSTVLTGSTSARAPAASMNYGSRPAFSSNFVYGSRVPLAPALGVSFALLGLNVHSTVLTGSTSARAPAASMNYGSRPAFSSNFVYGSRVPLAPALGVSFALEEATPAMSTKGKVVPTGTASVATAATESSAPADAASLAPPATAVPELPATASPKEAIENNFVYASRAPLAPSIGVAFEAPSLAPPATTSSEQTATTRPKKAIENKFVYASRAPLAPSLGVSFVAPSLAPPATTSSEQPATTRPKKAIENKFVYASWRKQALAPSIGVSFMID